MLEENKCLASIISDERSKPETVFKIAKTSAALSRLKIIWRDKNISLASEIKLMRKLILSAFLYACESWIRKKDPSADDEILSEASEHFLQRTCDELCASQQDPQCKWSAR